MINCLASEVGDDWALYQGDCVDVVSQLPNRSVDFAVYSPPFSNLYCYSGSERDMGNTVNDAEFLAQYSFLVREIYRALRPGRLVAVHCKDLVNYKNSSGKAGLRDFPGDIIRVHQEAGFAYASKVTIWKSPVTEMHKSKPHGLLYKQLRADSTFSRHGLAEYVVAFRKWAQDEDEQSEVRPVPHTREEFPLEQWQEWASPVWMNIDDKDVLNVQAARDDRDEKHMCPLALPIIERCTVLWSNPGDVVLSPFAGIGSEGVVALKLGRRFVGVELKESYFRRAGLNLRGVVHQGGLFDGVLGAQEGKR